MNQEQRRLLNAQKKLARKAVRKVERAAREREQKLRRTNLEKTQANAEAERKKLFKTTTTREEERRQEVKDFQKKTVKLEKTRLEDARKTADKIRKDWNWKDDLEQKEKERKEEEEIKRDEEEARREEDESTQPPKTDGDLAGAVVGAFHPELPEVFTFMNDNGMFPVIIGMMEQLIIEIGAVVELSHEIDETPVPPDWEAGTIIPGVRDKISLVMQWIAVIDSAQIGEGRWVRRFKKGSWKE